MTRAEVVTNPYGTPVSPFRDEPPATHIPGLLIEGPWTPALAARMSSSDIRGLYLNHARGWKSNGYAFLQDLPWLRLLDIIDVPIDDLTPISELTALTHLSLQAQIKGLVDFAALKQLRECHFTWWSGVEGIFECSSLERLDIRGVKEADLTGLSKLQDLRTLTLQANLRSVEALAGLEKLQKLELIDCRNLEDLSALGHLPNLRWLAIDGSKKIRDLGPLGELETLQVLDLSNIGTIPSLAPLVKLRKLRALAFAGTNTSIDDGDLSVLESMPDLSMLMFAPRKHYSHRLIKQWNWNDFYRPSRLLEPKARQRR